MAALERAEKTGLSETDLTGTDSTFVLYLF